METKEPILKLRGISKSFSGITVLHDVDIDLYPGEVHCLVGENGAGKSTLIKIISGAYTADQGDITFLEKIYKHYSPHWARENGINTIYQEIDLVPCLNAAENIFLGNEILTRSGSINWQETNRQAQKILDDMGVHINLNVPVNRLKIAHQQMVAIAKALSLKSKLIILDEPTAVFTKSEVDLLFQIIVRLKQQGIALLYISHHLDEIFNIGDRVTVLRDGNLVRSGLVAEFNKEILVKAMVGREIDYSLRNCETCDGEEILSAKNLCRNGIAQDISFSVHRGEIVGVAGLVGAGRTEMARLLIGADALTSGEILLHGQPVKIQSPKKALSLGIGMLPESRKDEGLVVIRSVAENISYSSVEKSARFTLVPWKAIKKKAIDLIDYLGVKPQKPNRQVLYLSGGNQQKVVLAKLLAAGCDLMILDEPTRGVDVGARQEIYRLMQELKKQNKAILMISSDLPEILTQADRILVMAKGKIVGELAGDQATEEKVLSLALQLGGEAA